jgi:transcriptional regulator with XRE-family HTH domain
MGKPRRKYMIGKRSIRLEMYNRRMALGLTCNDVGERIGILGSGYTGIENGRSKGYKMTQDAIYELLCPEKDISIDELFKLSNSVSE